MKISIQLSLKYLPKGPVYNRSALVQVQICRLFSAKPLPDPMLTQFIYATLGRDELSYGDKQVDEHVEVGGQIKIRSKNRENCQPHKLLLIETWYSLLIDTFSTEINQSSNIEGPLSAMRCH